MSHDRYYSGDHHRETNRAATLASWHLRRYSPLLLILFVGMMAFTGWASQFEVDEVARGTGEVIASSRVQIIQTVDGGVLRSLTVREGDRVQSGQVIAVLEQARLKASVAEIEARLAALKITALRLRAEVTGAESLTFSEALLRYPELVEVQQALFKQRKQGLSEDLRTLRRAVELAAEERTLVRKLARTGDVNRTEVISAARAHNEAEAALINRRNQFLEDARAELSNAEDEIAQNEQILTQRKQQLQDTVLRAGVPGVVKNIRVTTVGGVLREGEELMQIIPVDDEMIIEAKIRPVDIAYVKPGLSASLRLDPFDYTIFGSVPARVIYVSADTLKEDASNGQEIYYRVHLKAVDRPVLTSTGRQVELLPGMTAQVDIKTGQRPLLDILLKPLKKTLSESFGER